MCLFFGISQRRCFFKILGFDRRFFLGADRLDLFLSRFYIRRPSHRVDACTRARFVHDIDGLIRQETPVIYRSESRTAASNASSVSLALWCASYFGRKPFKIWTASSTVGASTLTVWNRRSSAASFSMYFRYSLRVVAPTHCSSPRLSAGLRMFEASMAPSAEPAPTIVCSSSMKRMTFLERRI